MENAARSCAALILGRRVEAEAVFPVRLGDAGTAAGSRSIRYGDLSRPEVIPVSEDRRLK